MMRTILFFKTGQTDVVAEKIAGATEVLKMADMKLLVVERRGRTFPIRRLIDFWHADGCIAECSGGAGNLSPKAFEKTPVVFLCSDPMITRGKAACVTSDYAAIAELACRELLACGFRHYAFVGRSERLYWSRNREDSFRSLVQMNGYDVSEFLVDERELMDDIRLQRRLRAWLQALPRPCGVFAANDALGIQLLLACAAEGLSVPNEIAVVGVDDNETLCEAAVPPLTSIRPNYRRTGAAAAELIVQILNSGASCAEHRKIRPSHITHRDSTRILKRRDREVEAAVKFIREHACDPCRPADAARLFTCSRRLAEIRFKATTGRTFNEEIIAVRLEKAFALMENPRVKHTAIPSLCGWQSEGQMRKVFHQATGLSLRDWRVSHCR